MGNPLITYLELLFIVLIFLIGAFILTIFFNILPANPLTSALYIDYGYMFGTFDTSFLFLLLILLAVDIAVSYMHPSIKNAISNIIFIFAFTFFFLNLNSIFIQVFNTLSFKTLLPNTYVVITNPYIAVVIFFALIIGTVLNFRKKEHQHHAEHKEYTYEDMS